MGHHLIARLQRRFVQHAVAAPWGRQFWLPIRIDGRRFVPYFRSRARLDLPGPRAPWPLGTRAEGSSESDDGTHLPPTNRRSNNHSRRVGCQRTHSGHDGAVRLLPGSDPGGLLRLLVPSQAAAVRVVPGLPPAGDGGGAMWRRWSAVGSSGLGTSAPANDHHDPRPHARPPPGPCSAACRSPRRGC